MEKAIFLAYGTGNNGKSTLLETVGAILGSGYAKSPSMDVWLAGKDKEPETAIAAMRGVRFAWNMEPDEGRRLSLNTLKRLSGGDTMTGRYLYGEHFNFQPEATLFLGANNKPHAPAHDTAFWNRLKLIPFEVSIPTAQQDKELKERLIREEGAGILAWLVQGCLDWQRDGLAEPPEVTQATNDYRKENDSVKTFVEECCHEGDKETVKVKAMDLYNAYRKFTTGPLSQPKFFQALVDRGFLKDRSSTGVWYKGIGLAADQRPEQSYVKD
jgi:putative DNA primase/helicase